MIKMLVPVLSLVALTSCGGAPAGWTGETETEAGPTLPEGVEGTDSANGSLERYEAKTDNGSGYAESITYDKVKDEFFVDNLAFDGANSAYTRGTAVRSLGGKEGINTGPYAVYEGPASFPDSATGDPITQLQHRAIYAESRNTTASGDARTRFAIVRTGSYVGYGFGGFVYAREGTTSIPRPTIANPNEAQGIFTGDYAGIVDYNMSSGMMLSSGDMELVIDFQDFNDGNTNGDAVRGYVTGRTFYNTAGTDVTDSYLAALNRHLEYTSGGYTTVPSLVFTIQPGVTLDNGEITGIVGNTVRNGLGEAVTNETGSYYAVLAGDANTADSEVVGVLVVEHAISDTVTQRETGGFIVYRGANN